MSHPAGRKRLRTLAIAAASLVAAAVLLGGCVRISNVQVNGGVTAGSDHAIVLESTATLSASSPIRGVIAIRIPSAWEVRSVTLTGPAVTGAITRSSVMEGVYATDWEATTGAGRNGHKAGYKWWVGYSTAKTWAIGDTSGVVISIDSHGRGGTYLLDLATGIAAMDDPEDLAGKGYWQVGSAGAAPTGVLLDQQITLYCFSDVQPEHPFYTAIQGLGAAGIVQGYGPQVGGYYEFRPDNSVYRAQYTKLICNALNMAGVPGFTVAEGMDPPVKFSDLGPDAPADLYPHEYVWTAYNHNIIKGYLDGTFRPYTAISRAHVITLTIRALQGLAVSRLAGPPPGYSGIWGRDMLPEHAANARIAEYNHLLDGIPLASGNAGMPRQEVAQIMWNMMNLLKP
ncbi:MAG: S-layer homology domain-containing protein [bacterium]